MRAYVLTIGDELLYGQCVDMNSAYLAEQLSSCCELSAMSSVGDDEQAMIEALRYASTRAELIFVSGGLGPTKDDRTREVLARFLEVPLEPSKDLEVQLTSYLRRRGGGSYEPRLSLLPKGAEALPNPVGLVAGIWYPKGDGAVVALPGVPAELRAIYEQSIRPRLERKLEARTSALQHLYCQTAGVPESKLAARLHEF